MTFDELTKEVGQYVYGEDDGMARIALASIVATRLKLGDPVWLIIIGPSSSGKSQILRPLALTDTKFIHRVDDLTENTFLSGAVVKKGSPSVSLLQRIGALGIIVISDFTVIFSKNNESRASILSQFRMIYDGEMVKYSGTKSEPIKWKGALGVLAGSTPSIYTHFEEVADMGERFIYYRMKQYDEERATRVSMARTVYGKELDDKLSALYLEYLKESVQKAMNEQVPALSSEVDERIIAIAMFAAKLRTPTHYDRFSKSIDKIPVSEFPMRVALQLRAIAQGLSVLSYNDTGKFEVCERDIAHIEWCAYSLANEERRAVLRILAQQAYGAMTSTQKVADTIGLSTDIARMNLQHLTAIGVCERTGNGNEHVWGIKSKHAWDIVRRMEGLVVDKVHEERAVTSEDGESFEEEQQRKFDEIF